MNLKRKVVLILVAISFWSGSSAQAVTLDGRIEAIVKPKTTLPAPVLKLQVASLEPLKGGTATDNFNAGITEANYPNYLLGKWGGELKTTWTGNANTTEKLPAEFVLGSVGKAVFEFERQGQLIRLKPNCVYFPAHVISHEQYLKSGTKPEEFSEQQKTNVMEHRTFTKLDLNNSKLFRANGTTVLRVIAYNELKTLRRGIVEQDMVVREYEANKFERFRETVLRFTWHRRDLLFSEIGIVTYEANGRISARSIMRGWLTPNWQKVAEELSADYHMTWDAIQKYGVPASK